MKLKRKFTVGGLMTALTCALVGSIAGTFAWYGYSTRATVALSREISADVANIQLGIVSDYEYEANPEYIADVDQRPDNYDESTPEFIIKKIDNPEYIADVDARPDDYDPNTPEKIDAKVAIEGLLPADENLICWAQPGNNLRLVSINSYLDLFGYANDQMRPVTSGRTTEDVANPDYDDQQLISDNNKPTIEKDIDFQPKQMPTYQDNNLADADKGDYFYLPIAIRVLDGDSNPTANTDVYLSDANVTLGQASDLNNAFRMGFKTYNDDVNDAQRKILNPGSNQVSGQTALGGILDLNKDGYVDVEEVDYEYLERNELVYGAVKSFEYVSHNVANPDYDPTDENSNEYNLIPNPKYNVYEGEPEFIVETAKTLYPTSDVVALDDERPVHNPTKHQGNTYTIESVDPYMQDWFGAVKDNGSNNALLATFSANNRLEHGTPLVSTGANCIAHVDLTVWVEGWDESVNETSLGVEFFLGLQFQIDRVD